MAISSDGCLIASGGEDQSVRIWDAESGEQLHRFDGHADWMWSVAFSADGHLLISSSDDGTIKLWDTKNEVLKVTMRSEQPYERMNITTATGLTPAQRIPTFLADYSSDTR